MTSQNVHYVVWLLFSSRGSIQGRRRILVLERGSYIRRDMVWEVKAEATIVLGKWETGTEHNKQIDSSESIGLDVESRYNRIG